MKNVNIDASGDDTRALASAQSKMTLAVVMRKVGFDKGPEAAARTASSAFHQVLYINEGNPNSTLRVLSDIPTINTVWIDAAEVASDEKRYRGGHHDALTTVSKTKTGTRQTKLDWNQPLIIVTEGLRFSSQGHKYMPQNMAYTSGLYTEAVIITADLSKDFGGDADAAKSFLKMQNLATVAIHTPVKTDARILDDHSHIAIKPEMLKAVEEMGFHEEFGTEVAVRNKLNVWVLRRRASADYSTKPKTLAKSAEAPKSDATVSQETLNYLKNLVRGTAAEGQS